MIFTNNFFYVHSSYSTANEATENVSKSTNVSPSYTNNNSDSIIPHCGNRSPERNELQASSTTRSSSNGGTTWTPLTPPQTQL